jgi:hypothetical protein
MAPAAVSVALRLELAEHALQRAPADLRRIGEQLAQLRELLLGRRFLLDLRGHV